MKKLLSLFVILFSVAASNFAQEADTVKSNPWVPSFVVGVGINQISFTNWVKGGENSISWTLFGDFRYDKASTVWSFRNQIKGAYGRSKIGESTYRTTDNDLYIENLASYNIGWAVNPFFSNAVRTQVSKGYDYKSTAASPPNISDLFDPGYITQSIGFTFDKYKSAVTRFGVAFQEVITNKFTQYADDPKTPEIESFKFETGIESVTDVDINLDTNINWKSKLRFFSRFESLEVWDVFWDNAITAKVNSWLQVNFSYTTLHEVKQSPRTQIRQGLQIGITYTLF